MHGNCINIPLDEAGDSPLCPLYTLFSEKEKHQALLPAILPAIKHITYIPPLPTKSPYFLILI